MPIWNPWHGCHKISPGCQNCYVYRRDSSFGKDSSIVTKTADFDLPVRRDRFMDYKLRTTEEPVYTCMTSDFFVEEADVWREEAWAMMREREDLHFVIITKRIHRFLDCLPADWGDGYENVTIECTCENQEMTEQRLPLFLTYPIRHRKLIHEPMLGPIFIEDYLRTGLIEQVTCGGESGEAARICDYVWVLSVREQCVRNGVPFYFKQTGAKFRKDGRLYRIQRKDQMPQARKAEIDYAETEGLTVAGGLFGRLQHSEFRSRFALKEKEREYVQKKGMEAIREHAAAFISERLAPAFPENDGKQTPMRGHPVFIAQHATATCCRGCLEKWHGIPKGRRLTEMEQNYIVSVICFWIKLQMHGGSGSPDIRTILQKK